ncbi:hypothetical protein Goari_003487 [Gossypium aridum]|uniref:Uncharacterized protein n=1 Tax=Gossypium aridum TaxID=34290 RepID=A0A7J8YCH3_GOSAI|nr:hypothetical protein [Gossypium aridum]
MALVWFLFQGLELIKASPTIQDSAS